MQEQSRTYKHYIIYKITNLVNGKIYIGKHRCDRLDDDYFGSGKLLQLAIAKYGIENFVFHLEIDLKSAEEMDLLEEMVVNQEFLKRDDVYNISRGGTNPCMYGDKNPFYGKTHSKDFCERTSKRFKGTKLTQDHKDKISSSIKHNVEEHPELREKFASLKNKKKCKNKITGKIVFFDKNHIPEEYEVFIDRKPAYYVPEEVKLENKKKKSERAKQSKWYNNGKSEIFCKPSEVPAGFNKGRLPGLNAGRKYSTETLDKMRKSKLGKPGTIVGMICITNGIENKFVNKNAKLPDGWWHGLTRQKTKQIIEEL